MATDERAEDVEPELEDEDGESVDSGEAAKKRKKVRHRTLAWIPPGALPANKQH
jgi:hypothetical protein